MEGWIKIHRQLLDWEWWDDNNTVKLFLYLLLKANHKPNKWKGTSINTGELITGRKVLAKECHLTEQSVRTSLNKLKSTNEITIKSTNKYSLIKLNNYNDYQQTNQPTTKRATNNQPTTNHKQECKELKNEKNKTKSPKNFSNEVKKLSDFLYQLILENNTGFKGNPRKWDDAFDKVLRIDKRQYDEVAKLIQLVQEDTFWRGNILSGDKFREKYDQLLIKMKDKKTGGLVFIS